MAGDIGVFCETERGRHSEKDSINLDLSFLGGGQHLASCYDGFPSSVWEQIESLHQQPLFFSSSEAAGKGKRLNSEELARVLVLVLACVCAPDDPAEDVSFRSSLNARSQKMKAPPSINLHPGRELLNTLQMFPWRQTY